MKSQKTVALFIDYEYVIYGVKEKHRRVPTPLKLINTALEYGRVSVARAFADFNDQAVIPHADQLAAGSIEKIQCPIEIRNERVKNYTDFYMLDHIYQTAHTHPDLTSYILMTGDGHFGSVAAYLKHRLQKDVVVVGYEGSINPRFEQAGCTVRFLEPEVYPSLPESEVDKLIQFVNTGESAGKVITASSTARLFKAPGFDQESLMSEIYRLIKETVFLQKLEQINGREVRRMYLNHAHPRVQGTFSRGNKD